MPTALNPIRPPNQLATPSELRSRERLRRLREDLPALALLLEARDRYAAADAAMILAAHLAEVCVELEAPGRLAAGPLSALPLPER